MSNSSEIERRTREILAGLPRGVSLVAAAKTRSPSEVRAALAGGAQIVGHNYVQEAKTAIDALGRATATWHMIGHLQRNKAREAARIFDLIQTVDSVALARKLDAESAKIGRVLPILIEINSAREPRKAGILPEDAVEIIREMGTLQSIRVEGLMTMGPLVADPDENRPIFRQTHELFEQIASLAIDSVEMKTLSMGMSDSYRVAIEEGATMVRLGTILFGARRAAPGET